MLYIIRIQKDRAPEQILYDHNHECITDRHCTFKQIRYRRNEVKIKCRFQCLFFTVIPLMCIANLIYEYQPGITNSGLALFIFFTVEGIVTIYIFARLYFTLKTRFNYEFHIHKKSMLLYFMIYLCFYIFHIAYELIVDIYVSGSTPLNLIIYENFCNQI